MAHIAVIYYSSTGYTHQIASAVAEGARSVGAEVRLRKVPELAAEETIAAKPAWKEHLEATRDVAEATLDDLDWADGFVFGTPTRFGLPSAQLKQFIDTAGPLWAQGKLQDKAVGAFTGAGNLHGGQESTLLALYNTIYHFGGLVVAPGYTDPLKFADGNPYGVSHVTGMNNEPLTDAEHAALDHLAQRIIKFGGKIKD